MVLPEWDGGRRKCPSVMEGIQTVMEGIQTFRVWRESEQTSIRSLLMVREFGEPIT